VEKNAAERFRFRGGLPAFEEETEFRLTAAAEWDPFVVLESVRQGGPRFVCVRAEAVAAGYKAHLAAEAEVELGAGGAGPEDLLYLAVVNEAPGGGLAANLAAPIVLNKRTGVGLQAVGAAPEYPAQATILGPGERESC